MKPLRMTGLVSMLLLWAPVSFAAAPTPDLPTAKQEAEKLAQLPPETPHGNIDHSGRKQKGRASFYAKQFNNRKMADGHKFNPDSNIAASRGCSLGNCDRGQRYLATLCVLDQWSRCRWNERCGGSGNVTFCHVGNCWLS